MSNYEENLKTIKEALDFAFLIAKQRDDLVKERDNLSKSLFEALLTCEKLRKDLKETKKKYSNEVSLVKKLAEENAELKTKLYPFKS